MNDFLFERTEGMHNKQTKKIAKHIQNTILKEEV